MTSLELDLIASQIEDDDATDLTKDDDATDLTKDDDEEESTDATIDEEEEIRVDADDTDSAIRDGHKGINRAAGTKIPASQIIARDIAIEPTAPLASLPADTDAAFGQWLAGSGLPSLN